MSYVTQLQSHLCQHQSDFLFCFWGNCVNLHLCVCNIACMACAHANLKFVPQKKKALFLHGPSIIITWVMQFINFQTCCIIITNECCNRHVCNSSEGRKVSFMLKEIIYGKSPIFSLVIDTFFFGRNINSGTRLVTWLRSIFWPNKITKSCMNHDCVTRCVP